MPCVVFLHFRKMPRNRSKIRNWIEYIAFRGIIDFIGLFSIKTSMKIGELFGKLCLRIFPRLKRTGIRNLELALPELSKTEHKRIIRGVFESLGRQLGFVSHFGKIDLKEFSQIVELKGRENLDKNLSQGRGILFFTGHFGGWEVFNILPSTLGFQLNILVRRIDNPLIESYVDKIRTRFGTITIDKNKANRKLFQILKNGGCLGILADLNVQEKGGVFVDFFGIKASTTTSIAKLALKTKASILPAFVVWNGEKYVVYIESEIPYDEVENKENIREITQKITAKIEEYVRRYPEQWLWIHRRWNTRPKGELSLY